MKVDERNLADEESQKQPNPAADQTGIEPKAEATPRLTEPQTFEVEKSENSVDLGKTPTFSIPKIEKHYCSICMVDQPIRTKHCSLCKRCVPSFDHHCLWVGNCIGEKNKPLFFIFLNYQTIQLLLLSARSVYLLYGVPLGFRDYTWQEWVLCLLVLIYTCLGLSVGSLLRYHWIFAFKNITTWEFLRWDDISYLRGFEFDQGSPFSTSYFDNLNSYFRPSCRTFYDWVPVKTPKLTN